MGPARSDITAENRGIGRTGCAAAGAVAADFAGTSVVVPAAGMFAPDPLETGKAVWADRLKVMQRSVSSIDVTLRKHVQDYLENRRRDVAAGELSAGRVSKLTSQLTDFQDSG